MIEDFIAVARTFHDLPLSQDATDALDLAALHGAAGSLQWPDLVQEFRLVILSPAGSGKTAEIRHMAKQMREQGQPSFFLRIENIVGQFEEAFEPGAGDLEAFRSWVESDGEGWVFLDSVDEARLRDPVDFERAIRRIGKELTPALARAHIIITGRSAAWRARSDLTLCRNSLPFAVDTWAASPSPGADSAAVASEPTASSTRATAPFRFVALDDLHGAQINIFAKGKGVKDIAAFRRAIDSKDAWSLTTRPIDLAELANFWNRHAKVGSRLELIRASVERRLVEHDPDRAQLATLAPDRLRVGAMLLAAAVSLTRESAIRILDAGGQSKGLDPREILPSWKDAEISQLLSRPIFDAGMYGTVRFHHGWVREYLTAEWLHGLRAIQASRARIEGLFFRPQYGIEVVVPALRTVLPWLSLLDANIRERVRRTAPEIFFEGGDPSELPPELRRHLLNEACEQLARPAASRSWTDYAAVQRFANPDLADEIRSLLSKYADSEEVVYFLMRMVWQGEIRACAPDAVRIARDQHETSTRVVAIRAVATVGTPEDMATVRAALVRAPAEIPREVLAEVLEFLPRDRPSVDWLLRAIVQTKPKERHHYDQVTEELARTVAEIDLEDLAHYVRGIAPLLRKPPVIERGLNAISRRYAWLSRSAVLALDRLISAHHPSALERPALSLLRRLPMAHDQEDNAIRELKVDLSERVANWTELNRRLFWYDVQASRRERAAKKPGERLTDVWGVGIFGSYWRFTDSDFDAVYQDIKGRAQLDDRLVVLSLAFLLYRQSGKPPAWRQRLHRLANKDAALASALHAYLHPVRDNARQWRQQEARWKKRAALDAQRQAKNEADWREFLQKNAEGLRLPATDKGITQGQYYLQNRMRQTERSSSHWADGNWQDLIPEFGDAVARAFRDGAVASWRHHRPKLLSDGREANRTPVQTIFGLVGLEIEALEDSSFPANLSPAEAELATRYALLELNGFPGWLPALYRVHPDAVLGVVLGEIDFELRTATPEAESHYVLSDVSWSGDWMWDRLAPALISRLSKPVANLKQLRQLLAVLTGSTVDDATLAALARTRAQDEASEEGAALWFAAWIGVDPSAAMSVLSTRLRSILNGEDRTLFAMRFATALLGGRRERGVARENFHAVAHLEALYLLLHEHVQQKDDIDRTGGGVFSPGLRDDAQDSREGLLTLLRAIPGKEAFLAFMRIAAAHPESRSGAWIGLRAQEKAALDADLESWSPTQVRDFNAHLERTPANHRELWDLAIDRLVDLKMDLEDGDNSNASILLGAKETQVRIYVSGWCRDRAQGRYIVPSEEEMADAKRPDIRFQSSAFDAPVPIELKRADEWTGPELFERLQNQLGGDYLRDRHSARGIYLLVYQGKTKKWQLPDGSFATSFGALVEALQEHWHSLAPLYPGIDDLRVIGIDLTRRGDADAGSIGQSRPRRRERQAFSQKPAR